MPLCCWNSKYWFHPHICSSASFLCWSCWLTSLMHVNNPIFTLQCCCAFKSSGLWRLSYTVVYILNYEVHSSLILVTSLNIWISNVWTILTLYYIYYLLLLLLLLLHIIASTIHESLREPIYVGETIPSFADWSLEYQDRQPTFPHQKPRPLQLLPDMPFICQWNNLI
jgi:hypothetical protein